MSLAVALLSPGVHSDSLSKALPHNMSGLVNPALLVAPIVLLVLIGLRDKTIFLAARGEQYLPALVFFAALPFVNMIVALKMLIVVVWVGAGFSKFGKHFSNVIPPMVSNSVHSRPNGSSGPTTATSRATCGRRGWRTSWRTSTAPRSRSSPRWSCSSPPTSG